jgi:preprotein translocase subunit YajC
MSINFVSILLAAGEAPQSSALSTFAPMIVIFVLFYFMLIRPQRRAQKEHQIKLAAVKSGDEVIACGGIHGLVTNVADRVVTLKIADNVKIRIEKASIVSIVKKSEEPAPAPTPSPAEPETAAR